VLGKRQEQVLGHLDQCFAGRDVDVDVPRRDAVSLDHESSPFRPVDRRATAGAAQFLDQSYVDRRTVRGWLPTVVHEDTVKTRMWRNKYFSADLLTLDYAAASGRSICA
jgi:hypothetical protein